MRKSFKGKIASGGQQLIKLATIRGKVGYQIKKFQVIEEETGVTADLEAVVKIFRTEQSAVDGTVDFTNSNLLAAIGYTTTNGANYPVKSTIIFDNEVFNQDIYITHKDNGGADAINFYIELEAVDISESSAEYYTLQSLRTTSR